MWAAVTKGLDRRASIVIDKGRSMATTLINAFEHQPEYENMFITPQEALDRCTQRSLLIVVDITFHLVCGESRSFKGHSARGRHRPPPHDGDAH